MHADFMYFLSGHLGPSFVHFSFFHKTISGDTKLHQRQDDCSLGYSVFFSGYLNEERVDSCIICKGSCKSLSK